MVLPEEESEQNPEGKRPGEKQACFRHPHKTYQEHTCCNHKTSAMIRDYSSAIGPIRLNMSWL